MDENRENNPYVSYAAVESIMTSKDKIIYRILVGWLITILLFAASTFAWLYFFSQFDISDESYNDIYTQDGYGNNNINTGEQGGVRFGPDISENLSQENDNTSE